MSTVWKEFMAGRNDSGPTLAITLGFIVLLLAGCNSGTGDVYGQQEEDDIVVTSENSAITISSERYDVNAIPIGVEWEYDVPACMESNGNLTPVQMDRPERGMNVLWLLADVPAGERRTYTPSERTDCAGSIFKWESIESTRSLLQVNDMPRIEYVHPSFDADNAEATMKPFHHIYAPDGSHRITKGVGGNHSHHRGLFYGYSNIQYDSKTVSTWGGSSGRQEHVRTVQEWSGPVYGGHEVIIDWKNEDGEVFAEESRKVRVYGRPGGEVWIDVESVLSSTVGPIELGGDHHHAGLQFRAAQYVYDNPERSRFLRPEEWSEYPEDEEMDDSEGYVDSPWNGFQFVVDGEPYTVGYFSHPENPSGGQMSERLYGRFGEFIPGVVIDQNEPLRLRYRLLIESRHQTDRNRLESEYAAYKIQ